MARKFRDHVRTNVIGYLALFVALSGTGWAASELSKDEVKSRHIKNAGVKTKDLADNAVTSPKVADGSLLGEDFAAGQLPQGPPGEQGPQGQQGVQGEQGLQGEQGASGATNVVRRNGPLIVVVADSTGTARVSCSPGEKAVGGGHEINSDGSSNAKDLLIGFSRPTRNASGVPDGWEVMAVNQDENGSNTGFLEVAAVVVCASP